MFTSDEDAHKILDHSLNKHEIVAHFLKATIHFRFRLRVTTFGRAVTGDRAQQSIHLPAFFITFRVVGRPNRFLFDHRALEQSKLTTQLHPIHILEPVNCGLFKRSSVATIKSGEYLLWTKYFCILGHLFGMKQEWDFSQEVIKCQDSLVLWRMNEESEINLFRPGKSAVVVRFWNVVSRLCHRAFNMKFGLKERMVSNNIGNNMENILESLVGIPVLLMKLIVRQNFAHTKILYVELHWTE